MIGNIHSIESMGLVDGPGVRYVVFMQGCLLKCKYCHNPDTWNKEQYSFQITPDELVKRILRYREYFATDGGVTFSGGEPLLQIDFLIETCKLLKQHSVNVCIDTAGVGQTKTENYNEKVKQLLQYADLILLDIKHTDPIKYKQLTGKDISEFNIFLSILQNTSIPIWIRHVVVPTLTDGAKHINELKQYISALKNVAKIELLPYHTMGVEKYCQLGIKYPLANILPPTQAEMNVYNEIINKREK